MNRMNSRQAKKVSKHAKALLIQMGFPESAFYLAPSRHAVGRRPRHFELWHSALHADEAVWLLVEVYHRDTGRSSTRARDLLRWARSPALRRRLALKGAAL